MSYPRLFLDFMRRDWVSLSLIGAAWIGLLYSRSLLSITTGVWAALAIAALLDRDSRRTLDQPMVYALAGLWGLYLVSGLWSTDCAQWARRVWINIPYLILPAGFLALGRRPHGWMDRSLRITVSILSLSMLATLLNYFLKIDTLDEVYKYGQTIPTPVLHVRYALIMASSLFIISTLYVYDGYLRSDRWLIILSTVLLILGLHILAVRTGLLLLYIGGILWVIYYAIRRRRYFLIPLCLTIMVGIAAVSYQYLPTIKNKIEYVLWDLEQLSHKGPDASYSDNLRITSMQAGWEYARRHPILGAGAGDIESAMQDTYRRDFPGLDPGADFPPVNQPIFWWVAFGLVGGTIACLLWLLPLGRITGGIHYLGISWLYITVILSFIAEASIELQIGKQFFLLWLGWLYLPLAEDR